MNRSFRAQESQMQAVVRQRQQVGSLRTSMKKEKEEDLALFLEMRKREKERNNLLLQNPDELGAPAGMFFFPFPFFFRLFPILDDLVRFPPFYFPFT